MYIHLPCTVDWGGASIFSLGKISTKEKSLCQTENIEKTLWQVKACNIIYVLPKGYKKTLQPKG